MTPYHSRWKLWYISRQKILQSIPSVAKQSSKIIIVLGLIIRWNDRIFGFGVYYEYWQYITPNESYNADKEERSYNIIFCCENNLQLWFTEMGLYSNKYTEYSNFRFTMNTDSISHKIKVMVHIRTKDIKMYSFIVRTIFNYHHRRLVGN